MRVMSTIGNPIPAGNDEMDVDNDVNMDNSTLPSFEGNINACNSMNRHEYIE